MSIESSHAEVFKSKRDIWITVFVWGTSILLWLFSFSIIASKGPVNERLIGTSITFLIGLIAPWFWLTTLYRVSTTSLYIQSGMLHKELTLRDIRRVTYKGPGGGYNFAFSRDSLHIEVEGSDRGYRVSPLNRRGFLTALEKRCDHLKAEGENLVQSST
jgi:hypothetical protein